MSVVGHFNPKCPVFPSLSLSPPRGTGFSKVCACGLLGAARVATNSGQKDKVGAERSPGWFAFLSHRNSWELWAASPGISEGETDWVETGRMERTGKKFKAAELRTLELLLPTSSAKCHPLPQDLSSKKPQGIIAPETPF